MSEKSVCIHGHFYQPPRENPWLEEVEAQESAHPYHDWNEKVTAECYGPNSVSRIMDPQWRIIGLVNNYSKISFNFGPTLLYWLIRHKPEVYQSIVDADRESQMAFSGHGSAIAQVYNHMILPLANRRDKETQVKWAIRDFEVRFNRFPEGLWLPETAVDTETLEVLAENKIKYTLLSPHQAAKMKKIGDKDWVNVSVGKIDPRRSYLCKLPSGKEINIFFFDKQTATDIAFGGLLQSGEAFARRLSDAFKGEGNESRIVSVASDGELYGHHHPHGDMTLAYCLYYLSANNLAKITNFGEFLKNHPPEFEVQIEENTSWSCAHGVERWRNDCGCNTGMHPGWKQEWRKPLREAMNWIRDQLSLPFENAAKDYLKDPWLARTQYINVILDRSDENIQKFLNEHSKKTLNEDEKRRAIKLLEMQRQAMLLFTSCGWFFDEISGIETVQVIMYAARAMQLAKEVLGLSLEDQFVKILEGAPSNIPEFSNGKRVYEIFVTPAIVDLTRVGAQHAILTLFFDEKRDSHNQDKAFSFSIVEDDVVRRERGKVHLSVTKLKVRSRITLDEEQVCCAAMWLGENNVSCGAKANMTEDTYLSVRDEIVASFDKGQASETIVLISKYFGENMYTLKTMFGDDQHRILKIIMEENQRKAEELYDIIYRDNAAIMQVLNEIRVKTPKPFLEAANIILNARIAQTLSSEEVDLEQLRQLVEKARVLSVELDAELIGVEASDSIAREFDKLQKSPQNMKYIEAIEKVVRLLRSLPIKLDLWKSQNTAYKIIQEVYNPLKEKGDEDSKAWISAFDHLCDAIGMKLG